MLNLSQISNFYFLAQQTYRDLKFELNLWKPQD